MKQPLRTALLGVGPSALEGVHGNNVPYKLFNYFFAWIIFLLAIIQCGYAFCQPLPRAPLHADEDGALLMGRKCTYPPSVRYG